VDLYVGGAEHAVLHLLYARFWHKVLFDCGVVSTPEPFRKLVNQGMILGEMDYHADPAAFAAHAAALKERGIEGIEDRKDGDVASIILRTRRDGHWAGLPDDLVEKRQGKVFVKDTDLEITGRAEKMSKSRGNVINPDDIVKEYGADSLRLYEMFMGPLTQVKPWSMKGVEGVSRFLSRVYRLVVDDETGELSSKLSGGEPTKDQLRALHAAIRKVGGDIERMDYNTAISAMMIFVNEAQAWDALPRSLLSTFVLILSPFAPHLAEELWNRLGHPDSLSGEAWPEVNEAYLKEDEIEIPVQVNGRVRGRIRIAPDAGEEAVFELALACPEVLPHLEGKSLKKKIYIPKRMVNLVAAG